MTSDSVTSLAEAFLATGTAALATEEQTTFPFLSECYQVAYVDTDVSAQATLCSKGNMPSSHEFVDVSDSRDDSPTKSDCE